MERARSAARCRPRKRFPPPRLSGITLYEPGALTLVVKAGTPMAEVEDALAAEGQMLAFEPPGPPSPCWAPTARRPSAAPSPSPLSGPRRIQKGACRDFMLGVRFVDGQGQVVKNGGRVMKNVTGLDLVKLHGGQYGTLGVLDRSRVQGASQGPIRVTIVGRLRCRRPCRA